MIASAAYVREKITYALLELEPLFKHHKLTFVARNTNPDLDADFIVSADDLEEVVTVLRDHAKRERART